jgi:hypothetical protein
MRSTRIAVEAYEEYVRTEAAARRIGDVRAAQDAAATAAEAARALGTITEDDVRTEWRISVGQAAHHLVTDRSRRFMTRFLRGQLAFMELLTDVITALGEGQVTTFGNWDITVSRMNRKEVRQNKDEVLDLDTLNRKMHDAIDPICERTGLRINELVKVPRYRAQLKRAIIKQGFLFE